MDSAPSRVAKCFRLRTLDTLALAFRPALLLRPTQLCFSSETELLVGFSSCLVVWGEAFLLIGLLERRSGLP